MSLRIFTDTSANLPAPLAQELGLEVLPFTYFRAEEPFTCLDTEHFNAEEFYGALKKGEKVTTSMVSIADYQTAFESALKDGFDVLYIGMSSGISGSYQASAIAASELQEQYPSRRVVAFDTYGASLGEGLIALTAARMLLRGADFDEILAEITDRRSHMMQIFTVDDLMYLHRGGRVSRVTAMIGSLLSIKPILRGDPEGHIIVTGKARGRRASIRTLAEDLAANIAIRDADSVGIAQAGCAEDARTLASLIRAATPVRDILIVPYEPVTGSHVGPGALALFYLSKNIRV